MMNKFIKSVSIAVLSLSAYSVHANFGSQNIGFFPKENVCQMTRDIAVGQNIYQKELDLSMLTLGGTWDVLAPLYRRQEGLYVGDTICEVTNDTTGLLLDTFTVDFLSAQNMSEFAKTYNLTYVSAQSKTMAVFKFNPEPLSDELAWLPNDHGLAKAHAEDMAVKANKVFDDNNVKNVSINIKWNF